MPRASLPRRAVAEALGTAFLLTAVVGSGTMGERLAEGNVAIALLANALATGAALLAILLAFGPISGGHLSPVVTLAEAVRGRCGLRDLAAYIPAQVVGAFAGVAAAHGMFGEPVFAPSHHARDGLPRAFGEFVATLGLLATIFGCSHSRPRAVPFAVAAYITAAYWFTASTSFANPAVTLARSLTDTFSGIRPSDVPGFIAAQLLGAATACALFRWLLPPSGAATSVSVAAPLIGAPTQEAP